MTHLEVVLSYLVQWYYEVTLPDILSVATQFWGVTDWYSEPSVLALRIRPGILFSPEYVLSLMEDLTEEVHADFLPMEGDDDDDVYSMKMMMRSDDVDDDDEEEWEASKGR
ncbi:hypothetical protein Tco_1310034 [Tanacetum coccineum]